MAEISEQIAGSVVEAFGARALKRKTIPAAERREEIVGGRVGLATAKSGAGGLVWSVGRGRVVVGADGVRWRIPDGAPASVERGVVVKAALPARSGVVTAVLGDRLGMVADTLYEAASEAEVVSAVKDATVGELHKVIPLYVVEKANVLKPAGFMSAVRNVRARLAKSYGPASREQLTAILRLLDKPWASIPTSVRNSLLEQIAAMVPLNTLEALEPQVIEQLGIGGRSVYRSIRRRLAGEIPVKAALSLPDEKAIEWLGKTTVAYARNQYGVIAGRMSERARGIIGRGMEAGYSSQDIAAQLHEQVKNSYESRMSNYWNVVASNAVGRSRASSQVHCYMEAEIRSVMAYAVMDERTTEFCRLIHEQIIDVQVVNEQLTGLESLTDLEQIKEANPWVQQRGNEWGVWKGGEWQRLMTVERPGAGTWDKGQYSAAFRGAKELADRGIGFPPYHALCRTTTITLGETEVTPVEVNLE